MTRRCRPTRGVSVFGLFGRWRFCSVVDTSCHQPRAAERPSVLRPSRDLKRMLIAAAVLDFALAALHVAIIFAGARAYRHFGAGEQFAEAAEVGRAWTTTVVIPQYSWHRYISDLLTTQPPERLRILHKERLGVGGGRTKHLMQSLSFQHLILLTDNQWPWSKLCTLVRGKATS